MLFFVECPFCASDLSKVIDKRSVAGTGEIRRRRECLKCSKRYTTYERSAELQIIVIKKDGKKEPFIQEKLRLGILKALEKRPSINRAQVIVERIEVRIRSKGFKEIPSRVLGRWVLSELKRLDPIAYLRFASVYRTFTDTKDFERELEALN